MIQRYIAFSLRTMTFVMFCIYFTFIFTFICTLDTLSKHTWTSPALLYTLLLSSSQSWGWVSQIRLCQVEAVAMKSGVTPACYSFFIDTLPPMLFAFLYPPPCYSFSCFANMLFAFLAYSMLLFLFLCMRYVLVILPILFVYFSSMLLFVRRGAKKPLVRRRVVVYIIYKLKSLCCAVKEVFKTLFLSFVIILVYFKTYIIEPAFISRNPTTATTDMGI